MAYEEWKNDSLLISDSYITHDVCNVQRCNGDSEQQNFFKQIDKHRFRFELKSIVLRLKL